jgi:hypothetical protein
MDWDFGLWAFWLSGVGEVIWDLRSYGVMEFEEIGDGDGG